MKANRSETQLARALGMKSFPEFLYSIVFPDECGNFIRPPKKPTVGYFPEEGQIASLKQLGDKIEEILETDRPIQIGRICTGGLLKNECKGIHTLVISGYKTICAKEQPELCRKLYKVQNTWGQAWQDQNNDGWVDAENLLKNINPPLNFGLLSWLK